ncbi:MAG: hypothetical protein LBK68_02415 [Candidatus Margulisbacteria bacterium]|jgi:hypothetical protein|nr:hypothetical protein [Candidatus Margulisiibacteriota bacterium]
MFRKIISAAEAETQIQQVSHSSGYINENILIKLRNPDGHIIAGRLQKNPDGSKTILALGSEPLYYARPLGPNADGQTYKWHTIDPFSGKKEALQNILALHDFDLTRIALLDTDPELFSEEQNLLGNYGSFVNASELAALTGRQEKSLFASLLNLGKQLIDLFF